MSDFDLLRNQSEVDTIRPWATPAARILLDSYFKIERAGEEIQRCNVEISRLITYIRDEDQFLITKATEFDESDPTMAYFIRAYQWQRGRFDARHMERFQKLAAKAGARFTGTLTPGRRLQPPPPEEAQQSAPPMEGVVETERIQAEARSRVLVDEMARMKVSEEGNDEEIGARAEDENAARALETVLLAGIDGVAVDTDSGIF